MAIHQTRPFPLSGDSYAFKIENGPSQRVAALQSAHNANATMDQHARAGLPDCLCANVYSQAQSFTNVKITGAPLIALSGNFTEFASHSLRDQRTTYRANHNNWRRLRGHIISGDHQPMPSPPSQISTKARLTSSRALRARPFNKGDYVLIIDWEVSIHRVLASGVFFAWFHPSAHRACHRRK